MRYVAALTFAALSLLLPFPATGQVPMRAQEPATFRGSSSALVVLPVTVTDSTGRLVTDLPQDRFAVFEEGRRQNIVAFSNADTPVSIALVIDASGSMQPKLGEVIAAAVSFARWSHPEDELQVLAFNDTVHDVLGGRTVRAEDTSALHAALRAIVPQGQTALYDAVLHGLHRLDTSAHARRVLVLVSDGGDNASTTELRAVLDRARRSNVTIYAIGLFDEHADDGNPGVLKNFAAETGGVRFLPRSPGPLMQACAQIAREIRNSFTIGYEPPEMDGRFRRVKVELTGPAVRGMRVRTRPGYVADRPE